MNTIYALLRRFATFMVAGVLTYAVDLWPNALKQAFAADVKTAVWIPIVWLLVEALQKMIREKLAGGK